MGAVDALVGPTATRRWRDFRDIYRTRSFCSSREVCAELPN